MGAKISDYVVSPEVTDIMERIIKSCPTVFSGFDIEAIGSVHTKNKKVKGNKPPIVMKPVKYPFDVWMDKTYICEVADDTWQSMTDKQKNLSVFHVMCSVPDGAFDEQSKNYGGKRRPDYVMYAEEFAVTGGVPNWMENPDARDVFDARAKDDLERVAVTLDGIANIPSDDSDDEDDL